MQRWVSLGGGLVAAGLSVYVVATSYRSPAPAFSADAAHDAKADALSDGGVPEAGPEPSGDPSADSRDGGIGSSMADGAPVPALPDGSPREVKFGVVLVTYAGAQGASPSARAKQAAREQAQKLSDEAQTDFKAAVRRGDSGSSEDVGRVRRGILEAAVEYALFTLPVGSVAGPIDTPRGFWIVKRIE
jgi:parvulin-like peptidyl-prolyl isomerase